MDKILYHRTFLTMDESCLLYTSLCGTGEGKIKEILERAVREEGYEGFLTLEPHLVVFDALKSLELADADSIIRENKATDGAEGSALQYYACLLYKSFDRNFLKKEFPGSAAIEY